MSLQNRNLIVAFWLVIAVMVLSFALFSWLRPSDPEEKIQIFVGDIPVVAKRKHISLRLQSPSLRNNDRVERLNLYYYIDPKVRAPQRISSTKRPWSRLKLIQPMTWRAKEIDEIFSMIEKRKALEHKNNWFGFSTPKNFRAYTLPASLGERMDSNAVFYRNSGDKLNILGRKKILLKGTSKNTPILLAPFGQIRFYPTEDNLMGETGDGADWLF